MSAPQTLKLPPPKLTVVATCLEPTPTVTTEKHSIETLVPNYTA